jgi:hypothetical protein
MSKKLASLLFCHTTSADMAIRLTKKLIELFPSGLVDVHTELSDCLLHLEEGQRNEEKRQNETIVENERKYWAKQYAQTRGGHYDDCEYGANS